MPGIKIISFLLFVLCVGLTTTALAEDVQLAEEATPALDEVLLKNGSRILGTVTSARDGLLSIETEFAGPLTIELEHIASMRTGEPTTVLMVDDTVIRDQPLQVEKEKLVVAVDSAAARSYALNEVLVVNPDPWELGEGYNWTGLVSVALNTQRGNTDTDELDYRLESIWRSLKDRYTLKMDGEIDETNDQKNADNWLILGKYDYFITDVTYWGFNVSAESDEFRDLDLRYLLGPYIGREFYTDPLFTLAAELGASYVNEDFIVAEDQDYPAANWYLRMTSNILGGESLLYFDQRGIWNLDQTSDIVVDTGIGLSFPLLWSLEAAAEILLEYDSGAVEGVEELDETYRFRVGYTW